MIAQGNALGLTAEGKVSREGANCQASKPCLGHLVAQDMFHMYGNMPDSVVAVIWGEGMKDVATQRIR